MVNRGQTPSQVIAIDRIGKPDWKIVKMTSACKAINAKLQETRRQDGAVGYQLTVALKPDAPAGVIRDEIRLITNDPETAEHPRPRSGPRSSGELTATPSLARPRQRHLGRRRAGQVRGEGVPAVRDRQDRWGPATASSSKEAEATKKTLHVLTLTYNPAEAKARGDLTQNVPDHHRPPRRGPDRRHRDFARRALIPRLPPLSLWERGLG